VATLALLAEQDPDRPVAVCRELTKLHEEVRRGRVAEIGAHYRREPPRGEVVLVVGAAQPGAQPDAHDRALVALRALVDAGARVRPAAKAISDLTGVPANRLYRALTERSDQPTP
jgi:16S rRNA (cytidine1402-2'-O)-methyltransferase